MNRSPHPHEIDPTPTDVTCVAALGSIAGESPVWSVDEACLWAVDHQGHLIHRVDPASGAVRSFELPGVVTSLAVHAEGGLIVTIDRRIARFDPESGRLAVLHEVDADRPDNRFNDGKCDRQGRFWAGTMGNTGWSEPVGTLFRLDRDGTLAPTVRGVRCSNGLGWSPDQRTFYYAESFAHVIHAFDYSPETGTLDQQRPFARIDPASGSFPDGIAVDDEGFVWNAQPVFGRIARYAPDGRLERIIEMPVSWATSCTFGGADLGTMFVTTSHEVLGPAELAEEPLAGGIFAFRPGVTGPAESTYRPTIGPKSAAGVRR